MRRGNKKKFGRVRKQRKALYKALATALIEHKKITTTQVKAKALSPFTDKLITKAKKGDVVSIRKLNKYLGQKAVFSSFFSTRIAG